jgi:hypothetical protein
MKREVLLLLVVQSNEQGAQLYSWDWKNKQYEIQQL